jgi:methyl-accepting chemotaxis protein
MKSFIWRRRKFIINRGLQVKLLFASLFYVFLALAVVGSGLFIPLFTEMDRPGETSLKLQQAAKMILYLHEHYWPAVLLSLVLICFFSIRTSHRIAGPLYRVMLVLESLKKGKLPKPVNARKGDHLTAEIEITNQMLEGLRMHMGEIQKAEADLYDAIAAFSKLIGHASSDELTSLMKDIREKRDKLEGRISYFKIEL